MKKIIVAAMACGMWACGTSEKEEVDALEEKVLQIHDEVMPRMGEIMNLKTQLQDQMAKMDSNSIAYRQVDSVKNMLTETDNAMMDWMDEYNADTLKALKPEDAKKYLDAELKKITEIKDKTGKNIEQAKVFINK